VREVREAENGGERSAGGEGGLIKVNFGFGERGGGEKFGEPLQGCSVDILSILS
jgi:hypothetical protein